MKMLVNVTRTSKAYWGREGVHKGVVSERCVRQSALPAAAAARQPPAAPYRRVNQWRESSRAPHSRLCRRYTRGDVRLGDESVCVGACRGCRNEEDSKGVTHGSEGGGGSTTEQQQQKTGVPL